jgi:rhomboid protease GluP
VSELNDETSPDPLTAAVWEERPEAPGFRPEVRSATPRVFVTYLIVFACIAVFAAMCVSGVSPITPSVDGLLAWGANFAPLVVFNHQGWRLLTSLFVHIGVLHLALNLWCLWSAAPLVERLYGNLGFVALYLMAGLGGSIASMAWHPQMISAGASGAIFGVYGALAAFLSVRRGVIPAAVLKPLFNSTISFIGYNLVLGSMDRRIDTAAHLGGLVTGFLAGLLTVSPWPVSSATRPSARRVILVGVAALGLFVAYRNVRAAIQADPELAQAYLGDERAGVALMRFMDQARPVMEDFDRIDRDLVRVLEQLRKPNPAPPALAVDRAAINRKLAELAGRTEADRLRFDQVPTDNPELSAMRQGLGRGFASQEEALKALRRALESNDATHMTGPDGFNRHRKDTQDQLGAYADALRNYTRKYHLKMNSPSADSKNRGS